jgi:uncharacterized phage protein gp47/JayE
MISRPTLQTLVNRITTDVQNAVGFATPLLPNSVLRVLAKVFAGSVHMLYGYIQYFSKQIFPDTAESAYLSEWASIWGITRQPASYAECVLTVTGIDGSDVPAGTLWIDPANGIEYASNADVVIAGATAITVTATTSGSAGTPAAGDTMSLVNPVAGVDAASIVSNAGIVPGEDTETDAALLTRLLARIQTPPQGGAATDYVAWARTISGVTRAWAYGGMFGPGTVGVTFVMDDQVGSPIPAGGTVAEVQAYINTVRPVTATVTVFAPTALPINFTIHLDTSTADAQTAIEAGLAAYISDAGYPGQTLLLTQLAAIVAENASGSDFVMTVPAANVPVGQSYMAVMGAITWV